MKTKVDLLLDCLAEECAEVIQRVCKAQRFGLREVQPGQEMTNADRILYEFDQTYRVHLGKTEPG